MSREENVTLIKSRAEFCLTNHGFFFACLFIFHLYVTFIVPDIFYNFLFCAIFFSVRHLEQKKWINGIFKNADF